MRAWSCEAVLAGYIEGFAMKAVTLLEKGKIAIKDDYNPERKLGEHDVEIRLMACGVCGSDVHYYTHGRIGPYVVEKPMVLGHEASGQIIRVGSGVTHLKVGDRVCMEPGIPRFDSAETLAGCYNLDPELTFFATPPIDGCLCETIIHPAAFTFKLPDEVSYYEGAMVEPVAIGMQSATKAGIRPGDIALVYGAGTIGIVTALCALAGGCSDIIIVDMVDSKLEVAASYKNIHAVNARTGDLKAVVADLTGGAGCDVVFECSGAGAVVTGICEHVKANGTVVLTGIPLELPPFDIAAAQAKEVTFKTVFRYANMFPRTIRLIRSGALDIKRLISKVFEFNDAVAAFERAASGTAGDVKIMIDCSKI